MSGYAGQERQHDGRAVNREKRRQKICKNRSDCRQIKEQFSIPASVRMRRQRRRGKKQHHRRNDEYHIVRHVGNAAIDNQPFCKIDQKVHEHDRIRESIKAPKEKFPFIHLAYYNANDMNIKGIISLPAALVFGGAAYADFEWQASVGAMGFIAPRYMGSDRYEPYYLPMVNLEYGPFFASVKQGVGAFVPVNEQRSLIFAPAIRWRVKRNLDGFSGAADYIKHVRPTATLNTILRLEPVLFNFRMTEGLVDDNKGSSFNLGITWRDYVASSLHLTLYTTAIYASRQYNQAYFGITEYERMLYGYDLYSPSAGLKSLDVGGLLKYFITESTSIDFAFEFLRLTGPAAKSPITYDRNQVLFGIGATYRF
jgi:outer membrane protein